jgi:hypothetical protein
VLTYYHPMLHRRRLLGLTLADIQSHLSGHGFNYSLDMLDEIERGERSFPLENPGFIVALSQSLKMPAAHLRQTARQAADMLKAKNAFQAKVQRLRPQNQMLLRFVLKHPIVTDVPGFDFLFALVKSFLLQLPDRWFAPH